MVTLYIGNLYTKVNKSTSPKEEIDKISKLLSVKISGCYFSRAYQLGRWDGFKHFFNRGTGTFFTGLLGYVKDNLPELEFTEIDERVRPEIQDNPDIALIGIDYHKFQEEAILQAIGKGRGIIASPVNSGKTVIAAGIIKILGLPANFITHRVNLLYQTREAFQNMLGIPVGILGDGVCEIEEVNVLSVVTLSEKLDEFKPLLKKTPVVFSDECHHISAKGWSNILKASGAYYRFGLSATPLMREDKDNLTVLGLTGDEIITVTEAEMVEAGISARSSVYVFEINKPTFPKHYPFNLTYDESIVFSEYRNGLITKFSKHFLDLGKSVMIVVWRIDHGEFLENLFNKAGIQAKFIKGGSKTQAVENRAVLKAFAERKLMCVIASTVIDEGLNIPAVDIMINGVGDKSPLKTIQRPGRGKRKKVYGENVLAIVDFMDFNSPYLKKHSLSRLTAYAGMKVPIYEVRDENWENVILIG